MEFVVDGQYLYNTHHFFDDAGWDEGRLNNLGTAVREWWDNNLHTYAPTVVSLTQITCRDLSVTNGLQTAVTVGLPTTGTSNDPPMPNNVTVAIKKATGQSGRSYHGRTYYIGLTRAQTNFNKLTTLFQGQLRDAFDALRNPGSGLFAPQLCVLSEVTGGNWRPQGIATIVTGIAVDITLDNQRRRLPGRGR